MIGSVLKTAVFPLAKVTEPTETFDENGEVVQTGGSSFWNTLAWVFHIALWVFAVFLSWQCTSGEPSTFIRVLWALLAAIFSYIYLIYYFIYRVLMGNTCPGGKTLFTDFIKVGALGKAPAPAVAPMAPLAK